MDIIVKEFAKLIVNQYIQEKKIKDTHLHAKKKFRKNYHVGISKKLIVVYQSINFVKMKDVVFFLLNSFHAIIMHKWNVLKTLKNSFKILRINVKSNAIKILNVIILVQTIVGNVLINYFMVNVQKIVEE